MYSWSSCRVFLIGDIFLSISKEDFLAAAVTQKLLQNVDDIVQIRVYLKPIIFLLKNETCAAPAIAVEWHYFSPSIVYVFVSRI